MEAFLDDMNRLIRKIRCEMDDAAWYSNNMRTWVRLNDGVRGYCQMVTMELCEGIIVDVRNTTNSYFLKLELTFLYGK